MKPDLTDWKAPAALAGKTLAAPSWVFPGSIAENCAFLAQKAQEVGLLFMEGAPALAYGEQDLPPSLAELPLSWHVHLPVDLDWADPAGAASLCLRLMEKADFLGAARAVLHPPGPGPAFISRLETFMLYWKRSGRESRDILLENQPESDIARLLEAAEKFEASLCFDLAHGLMAGLTAQSLPGGLMERVRLLHLCAPAPAGQKGHHHPLGALDERGSALGKKLCRSAAPGTVFMLELFHWEYFCASLPVLNAWME